MKVEAMKRALESYKAGTFVNLEWEREVTSAKAKKQGVVVYKHSKGLVRTDVNYRNLASVKDRPVVEGKESWFEHIGNGLLQSKKDDSKKYLQAFPVRGKKIKSTLTVVDETGVYQATAEELYEKGYVNKDVLPVSQQLDTFIVSVENIIAFGGNK